MFLGVDVHPWRSESNVPIDKYRPFDLSAIGMSDGFIVTWELRTGSFGSELGSSVRGRNFQLLCSSYAGAKLSWARPLLSDFIVSFIIYGGFYLKN